MFSSKRGRQRAQAALAASIAALQIPLAVRAANVTSWTGGGGSNNWSDGNNWNPTGTPGYGTLIFQGTSRTTSNNDNINNMYSIQLTGTANWTLGGSTLHFFDFGGIRPKIEQRSSGASTINFAVSFETNAGGAQTTAEINAVSGDLWMGGTVSMSNLVTNLDLFSNGHTLTFNNVISGTGGRGVRLFGNNTIVYRAANTYDGDTFILNGAMQFDTNGSVASSFIRLGETSGTNAAQFSLISSNGGQNISTAVNVRAGSSGAKSISSTNSSGANTLSGGIFLDTDVSVSEDNGGGTLTLSGTTLDLKNQTMTFNGAGNVLASGSFQNSTGSGKLTKNNSGYLVLSGNNSFTGDTAINNGTLVYSSATITNASTVRLGNTTGTNSATISIGNSAGATFAQTINVRAGSSGQKTITASNSSGTTSTYSGHIALDDNGTVYAPAAGATVAFTQARSSPSDTLTGTDIKGFTLTVDGPGNTTFSGTIYNSVNNGSILKQGSGALTYSGTNTYSGTTTVNGGTLFVNGQHTGGDNYAIGTNGSIRGSGVVTLASSKSFTLNGNISPGNSTGNLTLAGATNSSTTIFAPSGTYTWELNADAANGGTQGGTTGWDVLTIDSVSVTAGGSNSKFAVTVVGLNITNGTNWSPTSGEKHFTVVDHNGAGAGFTAGDVAKFDLIVTGFDSDENVGGFYLNATGGGDLELVYVPEPATIAIGCVASHMLLRRRRPRLGHRP